MDNITNEHNNKKPFLFEIRPHHGLCLQHYIGLGYNSHFTSNMDNILHALNTVEDAKIKLTSKGDIICKACPFYKERKCEHNRKSEEYDQKCLDATNLNFGDIILWKDYKQLLIDSILNENLLEKTCVNCVWIKTCLKVQEDKKSNN